ncbi:MAG: transglutaminase-like domain-containing protein [Acidobacteriota bacterium]
MKLGRWRGLALGIASLLAACCGASSVMASGFAVEGVDRARLLPPAGAAVEEYANSGYSLRRVDDEVLVEVAATPIESTAPFEPPPDADEVLVDRPIARLASGITLGSATQYEAASRILDWVARNIDYRLQRDASQEALDVLARREGYCTGVARLSVALLEAVGIEAREVAGYVFGGVGEPNGYHRWIEVRFADRGWTFSDPLNSHHYVPANYLRLSSETIRPDGGFDGLLLERHDAIAPIDAYPAAAAGIRARRNIARQLAAAVHVRVEDEEIGTAVLEGHATRWTHALIDGETTFVGLEPGIYRLRVLLAGRILRRHIRLDARQRASISLTSTSDRRPSSPAASRVTSPD